MTTKQNPFTYLWTIILSGILFISCTEKKSLNDVQFSPVPTFNPPTYICYKAPGEIIIDGKLSPGEWDAIPWTDEFTDIEGDKRPAPYYSTRAKMAHNEEGMFFAVWMEDPHVWATITEHDAVIYHDNDFEVFLNPSNDTHNYLEYEVNALGTVWDLYLSKPYRDPGHSILNNWEFIGMKSAVYVDGTLNNPKDTDKGWSVEIFIPWESIYQVMRGKEKPLPGEHMRVNFSRVQWTTEIQNGKYVKIPMPGEDKIREHNWVWAPTGLINIHLPEYWGYVQFSDKIAGTGEDSYIHSPDEEIKWLLRNLYYRQNEYAKQYKQFSENIKELKPEEFCPAEIVDKIRIQNTSSRYEISMPSPTGKTLHIREDGLVW